MFSFLNKGDINNTIKAITNFPGLFTSDGDKIKYSALNYATVMRHNLHDGAPIFRHIRQLEADIERDDINSIMSGCLPSTAAAAAQYASTKPTSPFTDNDIRRDNAVFALIMAKELAFLNRTVQMVSLIARKYQEEQEGDIEESGDGDLEEGGIKHHDEDDDSASESESEDQFYEDDSVPSVVFPLQRSSSSPTFESQHERERRRRPENQLVSTFLIATGRLYSKLNSLCQLVETSIITVNAMTTQDRPHSEANREKQLLAERLVILNIYMCFSKFDAEHRNPVVWAFIELRDISITCWRLMSMFAFSNLFRLTEGTEYATIYRPDDAIFTQGRDYNLTIPRYEREAAAEWAFGHHRCCNKATDADADADADALGVAKHDAELAAVVAACEEDDTLYE
jgi:hypothetical protein